MAVNLMERKSDCCGCSACYYACPKKAITMETDEFGFIYPKINDTLCAECGLCQKTCEYKNPKLKDPQMCFGLVIKDENEHLHAASGGAFTAAAETVLEKNGVVFGACISFTNGVSNVKHIKVDNISDLRRLQGSKYIQSSIGNTYREVKTYLNNNKLVLFSGTPCQIAGLKSFLKKEYSNLYTMDVICHGVPSNQLFNDYIQVLEKKYDGEVIDYHFRDKKKGWGMNSSVSISKNGNVIEKYIPAGLQSYFSLFLDGLIYRESCYSCPFAGKKRVSDITIGDYWGIEKQHPDLVKSGKVDMHAGISCLLVNTEKGKELLNLMSDKTECFETTFEKIALRNNQLNSPSERPEMRDTYLNAYRKEGYLGIEKEFKRNYKSQILRYSIKSKIPYKFKQKIKKILRKYIFKYR